MDNLSYFYGTGSAASNRLLKVTDGGQVTKGFIDGNTTTDDYGYDPNGNMVTDLNKGISTPITYNFLNLPEKIFRGSTNSTQYIYDATGRKLAQVTRFNSALERTDYVGEFQFDNERLQFISHEEGRVVYGGREQLAYNEMKYVTGITGRNATVSAVTMTDGNTYTKALVTSTANKPGMFPIATQSVIVGERYLVRVKGYRTSAAANAAVISLTLGAGTTELGTSATLPNSASTEAWVEQIYDVTTAGTLNIGVVFNGTVAVNDSFFINDFELVKLTTTTPEYQYNLKDHLGNVRMTFTAKREIETSLATMETANESAEVNKFIYYAEAVKVNSVLFDHTNAGSTYYATRLNGTTNERTGLAKSLSVMPGDTIRATVFAKYLDPTSGNWTQALASMMAAIAGGTAPGGTFVDGGLAGSTGGATAPYGTLLSKAGESGTSPKAYLNYVIFDRNFVLKDGGFLRVTEAAREYGQDGPHEELSKQLIISEAGYVYLYLSNDNVSLGGAQVEVYFDDFKVEHVKSPVVQAQDYYPFGLSFNSFNRENSTRNQYLFNSGSERQDELDLNIDLTQFRAYAPAMGRWWQLDTKPDYSTSLYSAFQNNPLSYNDPLGDTVRLPGASDTFVKQYNEATNKLREKGVSGNLNDLENSKKEFKVVQAEGDLKKEGGSSFDSESLTIYWNPYMGIANGDGNVLSPTTLLGHELDHGARWDKDPDASIRDLKVKDEAMDNKEEGRVIGGSETRTARELGEIGPDQISRKSHSGSELTPIRVKGPTSTQPIYEKDFHLKKKDKF